MTKTTASTAGSTKGRTQQVSFKEVPASVSFPTMEEEILQLWKRKDVFQRSMKERAGGPEYVFFEGPPTANGRPGIHHVLARAFKDMFPRYKTMQGYHVLRKGGWDTHGLPVELEVEKQLGLTGKEQIEEYGVAKFNQMCRESVWEYLSDWEALTERMAFWVSLEDAYVTMKNEYVQSLWWILKQLFDKGLLFEGYKVVPYCPRCGTPLSSHELSLGYQEGTVDPSVFVKFAVKGEDDAYLLAWTTTPWTLPGNAALAVGENIDYLKVKDHSGAYLYVAKERAEAVLDQGYERLSEMKGAALVGKEYEPLFRFGPPVEERFAYVIAADFVSTADGTGIVHVAPAFGADDLAVGQKHELPVFHTVDASGKFKQEVTPWAGLFVKDADPHISSDLEERGLLYKAETYEHTYPFCWRCETPLIYWAKETWYLRTSEFKDRLVALNDTINWVPDHIRGGRFGRWLENNVDWALGRDRYWATPIPIWKSDAPGSDHMECIGSVAELAAKSGRDLDDLDLHRPHVDEITWPAPDGGTMRRVSELCDVWFDSGSMPVAQWHYPFSNQDEWETYKQADYICEAIDQTRGWFYTLHAVSTLLFDRPAFKNVICLGHILAEDGSKMSKSRGNVVNPWQVFAEHGADATRWYMYTAGPPGNARRFSGNLVAEVKRRFLNTLWNTYSFFVVYANLQDVNGGNGGKLNRSPVSAEAALQDRWLLSELNRLVRDVTAAYEAYDVTAATRPIADFVDELSNWYVRLNRRRFWDGDADALSTLRHTLVTVSKLLAPAIPFISEEIYQNLVAGVEPDAPDSVHLASWPHFEDTAIDDQLHADMALAQKVTTLGRAARESASLKVRQPLQRVVVRARSEQENAGLERVKHLLLSELNVKALEFAGEADELVEVSVFPLPRQLGQKYGRGYPVIRSSFAKMDQRDLASRLEAGQTVTVEDEGEEYAVEPEDVEVRRTPSAGLAVAEDGGYLVAVTTTLTPELELEGHARELVRRVQQLRKDSELDISDRIALTLSESPLVGKLLSVHESYIVEETLTEELKLTTGSGEPFDTANVTFSLGEEEVTIGLNKL
ncbi:MAG: isoleucine--tRNA ligase [Caldilineaceae bacterium]|nr:isoleucine--tRNA ligase [Caldilineaceae bacterium]MDE0337163.1 isoleucine--tRNA ligase [Caldilineaceae bacterium]